MTIEHLLRVFITAGVMSFPPKSFVNGPGPTNQYSLLQRATAAHGKGEFEEARRLYRRFFVTRQTISMRCIFSALSSTTRTTR